MCEACVWSAFPQNSIFSSTHNDVFPPTDKWVSTLHRVILKAGDDMKNTTMIDRRQSIAYFCNINHDALVEPIYTCVDGAHPSKYEAVTAGKYLLDKHYASMKSSPSSRVASTSMECT